MPLCLLPYVFQTFCFRSLYMDTMWRFVKLSLTMNYNNKTHINHKGATQVLSKYWIRHWVIVAHLIYASAIFAIKIISDIRESMEEPYHKLDSSRYQSGMNGWHYYENLLYRMGIDFPYCHDAIQLYESVSYNPMWNQ